MQAKVYLPINESQFNSLIEHAFEHRNNLAVVHFVNYDSTQKNDALEKMQEIFNAVSKKSEYKRAGLLFIEVNLNDIPSLTEVYNIHDDSTVLLFKNGKVLVDHKSQPISLNNYANNEELNRFINERFGVKIQKNREHRKRIARQEIEYRRIRPEYRPVRSRYYDYNQPKVYYMYDEPHSYIYYEPYDYWYEYPYHPYLNRGYPYSGYGYPYGYGYRYGYGYGPGVSVGIDGLGIGFGFGF